MTVRSITDARSEQEKDHAEKTKRLFEERPEIARTAIIIDPESGVTLIPDWMDPLRAADVLTNAAFTMRLGVYLERSEDDH